MPATDSTERPQPPPWRPWVKAESLTRCSLYWLPATQFPSRQQERAWMRAFLYRLFDHLSADKLIPQSFMEMTHIHRFCQDEFIQCSLDLQPIFSFSRAPWGPMPAAINPEETDQIRSGDKPFVLSNYTDGYCYWIPKYDQKPFLDRFLGYGGVTILFPGPDPNTVAPPIKISPGVRNSPHFKEIFAMGDPEAELNKALLLKHKFLGATKKLFGRGWEERVEYRGLLFVLPRLRSADFFSLEQEVLEGLFDASPLYFTESPADRGMLLASSRSLDEVIAAIVESLDQEKIHFPLEAPDDRAR
jgi:hypothetical protein